MTTIAWDGKTLACDRGLWAGNMQTEVCKLFRFTTGDIKRKGYPHGAWASTGDWAFNHAFKEWLMDGDAPFPLIGKEANIDASIGIMVASHTCEAYTVHMRGTITPIVGIAAAGAGGMFALGVLAAGGSSVHAIQLAMKYTDAAAFGVDQWSPT